MVRFDARLRPVQTEPFSVGDSRETPSLGWSLRCAGDDCVALAATSASPTLIYALDLSPRESPFAAPSVAPPALDVPRVTGLTTLTSGLPFAQVDAADVAGTTLLATLSMPVARLQEAHPVTKLHHGGVVTVRALDAKGAPTDAPTLLVTSRAIPAGGLAIAAGGTPDDGALVAWVAPDGGDPQVHLTRVDRQGAKVKEMQLTSSQGDATDVVLAWVGDGWLVGWIDGRDGNGEVYATKVDRDLKRVAREERITRAPGDAGDLAMAVQGDLAWLAWSDPRESPKDGVSDIYATTIRTRDAKKAGSEIRVMATAAHSRSPKIAPVTGGALLAWIEVSPPGLDAPAATMLARLDASGTVVGAPGKIALAGRGSPTAVALESAPIGVRAIVARNDGDEVVLDAVTTRSDGAEVGAWKVLDLDAPASFDITMSLLGDALYFDDVGMAIASHRVRRAALSWGR
jgi:hypothetical protein